MSLYSRSENDAQSLKVLNTTEKNSVDKYDHDNTLIVDGDSATEGAQGYATVARRTIFIDDTEATLAENKERGLTAPGWWEYMTYTDSSGKTRHKAQHLVAFKDAPVNAADADDSVGADAASNIVLFATWDGIATAPTPAVGDTATYSVAGDAGSPFVADANTILNTGDAAYELAGGTPVFQWQRQKTSSGRWSNITATLDGGIYTQGADGPVLEIDPAAFGDTSLDGYEFRVKVTSTAGAEEVTSVDLALSVTA